MNDTIVVTRGNTARNVKLYREVGSTDKLPVGCGWYISEELREWREDTKQAVLARCDKEMLDKMLEEARSVGCQAYSLMYSSWHIKDGIICSSMITNPFTMYTFCDGIVYRAFTGETCPETMPGAQKVGRFWTLDPRGEKLASVMR